MNQVHIVYSQFISNRKRIKDEGGGTMDRKPVNLLYRRMLDLGYADVTEFVRQSKIDLSFETCRRALYDNRQNIRYEYVVRLMQALDFSPQEIASELIERGDTHLHRLVLESQKGTVLTSQEKRLVDAVRKIDNPKIYDVLMGVVAIHDTHDHEKKKAG
jgi:hypothetical protein